MLDTHIAPIQKLFYFTPPCMDDSERYLWFTCLFPPATYVTLAVIDFETDTIYHFSDASPSGFANPLIDKDTGDIYYSDTTTVYRRSPTPEIPLDKICDIQKVFLKIMQNHTEFQHILLLVLAKRRCFLIQVLTVE